MGEGNSGSLISLCAIPYEGRFKTGRPPPTGASNGPVDGAGRGHVAGIEHSTSLPGWQSGPRIPA